MAVSLAVLEGEELAGARAVPGEPGGAVERVLRNAAAPPLVEGDELDADALGMAA